MDINAIAAQYKKNDECSIENMTDNHQRYSGTKARFEKKEDFRRGLSVYDIGKLAVLPNTKTGLDAINNGGAPMDYNPYTKQVFVDGSDSHMLLIGATGSKKTRLVVMPTVRILAAAGENMIVCDPKGEIYNRTAAFLEEKGYCIRTINLREPDKGDGWNLLQIPYGHFIAGNVDKACELINDMANNLIPLSLKDPYWDMSARDMLFGLVLLLFYMAKEQKIPNVAVNMSGVLKLREELFFSTKSREIMKSNLWLFAKRYPLIRMRLNGVVICPEDTMSCIISVFDQHMSCFSMQPQITDLLSHSTFDLNGLGFEKMAVYLIMPDEKTTYHKIITAQLKQMYEILIDNAYSKTSGNRFRIRVNFVLDEFSSLPTISDFPQMIAASRSRNIRFFLVLQSKNQLLQRYHEETETIMSNCANWVFLTSREITLLQEISQLGGIKDEKGEKLISVSWLQHLDKEKGECLIFCGRKHPYVAELPDIDEYDHGEYVRKSMPERCDGRAITGSITAESFQDLVRDERMEADERRQREEMMRKIGLTVSQLQEEDENGSSK